MSSRANTSLSIASDDIYRKVQIQFLYYVIGSKRFFGKSVGDKIKIAQLSYDTTNESAIVECEIVVESGMFWIFLSQC